MTKKQRLVRCKTERKTITKLDFISSIKKAMADYFVSALAKRLGYTKALKLNDIEIHGKDVFMIYTTTKKDDTFVTVKPEIIEEVER